MLELLVAHSVTVVSRLIVVKSVKIALKRNSPEWETANQFF